MLSEDEWFRFANGDYAHPVEVCRLRSTIVTYLGVQTDIVRISPSYARKLRFKHGLEHHHFALMRPTAETGRVLADGPRHLIFYKYFDDIESYMQLVLKPTRNGQEVWVCTFHRQTAREIARKSKKCPALNI
jgi:hypothetical protein